MASTTWLPTRRSSPISMSPGRGVFDREWIVCSSDMHEAWARDRAVAMGLLSRFGGNPDGRLGRVSRPGYSGTGRHLEGPARGVDGEQLVEPLVARGRLHPLGGHVDGHIGDAGAALAQAVALEAL